MKTRGKGGEDDEKEADVERRGRWDGKDKNGRHEVEEHQGHRSHKLRKTERQLPATYSITTLRVRGERAEAHHERPPRVAANSRPQTDQPPKGVQTRRAGIPHILSDQLSAKRCSRVRARNYHETSGASLL